MSAVRALATPDGGYAVLVPGANAVDMVPGRPQPEAPGAPSLRLFDTGAACYLMLGARWPVAEQWLRTQAPATWHDHGYRGQTAQVRVAISGTPTLTFAVSAVPDGEPSIVASVATSGYPPFTAVMHLPIGPDAASAVRAAGDGERGRAWLTITATLAQKLVLDMSVFSSTALLYHEGSVTVTADLADWDAPPALLT